LRFSWRRVRIGRQIPFRFPSGSTVSRGRPQTAFIAKNGNRSSAFCHLRPARKAHHLDKACRVCRAWTFPATAGSASCSRMSAGFRPFPSRICAARDRSARNIPSRRCSVPTLLWPSRSASSPARSRIFLQSLVRGTSTDVEKGSRRVMHLSISVRISDAKSVAPRNLFINAGSSRRSPSSACSVSM